MASEAQARQAEIEKRAAEIRKAREDGEHSRALIEAFAEGRGGQTYEQHHGGEVKVVTEPAPRPFEDPRERRAFCLKSAIEAKAFIVSFRDMEGTEAQDRIIAAARAFEAYINGADSEAS